MLKLMFPPLWLLLSVLVVVNSGTTYAETRMQRRFVNVGVDVNRVQTNYEYFGGSLIAASSRKLVVFGMVWFSFNTTVGNVTIHKVLPVVADDNPVFAWVAIAQNDSMNVEWFSTLETYPGSQILVMSVLGYSTGVYATGTFGRGIFSAFGTLYPDDAIANDARYCPWFAKLEDTGKVVWFLRARCSSSLGEFIPRDMDTQNGLLLVVGEGSGSITLGGKVLQSFSSKSGSIIAINTTDGSVPWISIAPYVLSFRAVSGGSGNIAYFVGAATSNIPNVVTASSSTKAFVGQVNVTTGVYSGVAFIWSKRTIDSLRFSAIRYFNKKLFVQAFVDCSYATCDTTDEASCSSTHVLSTTVEFPSRYMFFQYDLKTTSWTQLAEYIDCCSQPDVIYWIYTYQLQPPGQIVIDPINRLMFELMPALYQQQYTGCPSYTTHEQYALQKKYESFGEDAVVLMRDLDTLECLGVASYGTPQSWYSYARDVKMGISLFPGSHQLYMSTGISGLYCYQTLGAAYLLFLPCPCTHGVCNNMGKCLCLPGWGGVRCDKRCPSSDSSKECSGHGFCNRNTVLCTCNFGYTGAACNITECNTHGKKLGGVCLCAAGYTGQNCSATCAL